MTWTATPWIESGSRHAPTRELPPPDIFGLGNPGAQAHVSHPLGRRASYNQVFQDLIQNVIQMLRQVVAARRDLAPQAEHLLLTNLGQ